MARNSIPQPDVPLFNQAGGISKDWYDYLLSVKSTAGSSTADLQALRDAIAIKQPLNGNLSYASQISAPGLIARTTAGPWLPRTLAPPVAGMVIADPSGDLGDPTFSLANDLAALEGLATTGYASRIGTDTWAVRNMLGTASRLTVTNNAGIAGDSVFDISPAYVGQASITTLGTIATGVWNGTTIAVANGGTGSTTAPGALTNLGVTTGTYTPTAAGIANITALAVYSAVWIRVGDVVIVSGLVDVDPTAVGVTQFSLTLPVASNFGSGVQASGLTNCGQDPERAGTVNAIASTSLVLVGFTAGSGVNATSAYQFIYRVIP
jgi:hypothetical protein